MACAYWFVFFKLQRVVAVLLPPIIISIYNEHSFYYSFVVMLHILVVFQLVYVLMMVVKQSTADVFLIDWEPPRAKGEAK
jgi:hypothetical protein